MKPSELRRIRNSLGLTQAEMGRALGAHRVSVARWEAGTRTVPAPVARLARLLGEPVGPTPEMVEAAQDAYMPFGDMELAIRMALLAAPAVQGEPVAQRIINNTPEGMGAAIDARRIEENGNG